MIDIYLVVIGLTVLFISFPLIVGFIQDKLNTDDDETIID